MNVKSLIAIFVTLICSARTNVKRRITFSLKHSRYFEFRTKQILNERKFLEHSSTPVLIEVKVQSLKIDNIVDSLVIFFQEESLLPSILYGSKIAYFKSIVFGKEMSV
jgi:hypothetical protein